MSNRKPKESFEEYVERSSYEYAMWLFDCGMTIKDAEEKLLDSNHYNEYAIKGHRRAIKEARKAKHMANELKRAEWQAAHGYLPYCATMHVHVC